MFFIILLDYFDLEFMVNLSFTSFELDSLVFPSTSIFTVNEIASRSAGNGKMADDGDSQAAHTRREWCAQDGTQ